MAFPVGDRGRVPRKARPKPRVKAVPKRTGVFAGSPVQAPVQRITSRTRRRVERVERRLPNPRVPERQASPPGGSTAFDRGLPAAPSDRLKNAAERRTRRAARRVPNDPAFPLFPVLPSYTPAQRDLIIDRVRGYARRRGGAAEAYRNANARERRLMDVAAVLEVQRNQQRRAAGLAPRLIEQRPRQPQNVIDAGLATVMGSRVFSGHGGALRPWANLLRSVVVETPRAYLDDPGKTLGSDAGFALDAVAGLVKAPYYVATGRGGELVDSIAEDYRQTYGPAMRGDFPAFRRTVQEQGGLRIAADVAPVASAGLRLAGGAARLGALGARAQRAVTQPRPVRRTSFGETRRQRDETDKLFPNPVRVATQRNRDRARERRFERGDARRVARATEEAIRAETPAGSRRVLRPAPTPEVADRAVAQAGGRVVRRRDGKVRAVVQPAARGGRDPVPANRGMDERLRAQGWTRQKTVDGFTYFPPREVVSRSRRRQGFEQTRSAARAKGVGVNRIRSLGAEAGKEFRRALKGLSKPEQRALFFAVTGQASDVRHLDAIEAMIVGERGSDARVPKSALEPWQIDNLRDIDYLRQHADEAFTPQMLERAERIRRLNEREERQNPYLAAEQRVAARFGMQAQAMGMERGPAHSGAAGASRKGVGQAYEPRAVAKSVERRARALYRQGRREEADNLRVLAAALDTARRSGLAKAAGSPRKEPAVHYASRVAAAGRESGRPRAGFAPSEPFFDPHFANFTAGGSDAPRPFRTRSYSLMKRGGQRTDPQVLYDGIQRNIKYRVTANLVADLFNRHAHPEYRDMTLLELRKAMAREGFDLSEVAIWIPDRYRTTLTELAEEIEDLRAAGRRQPPDDPTQPAALAGAEQGEVSALGRALDESVVRVSSLEQLDRVIEQTGGKLRGSLVPRAVHKEITGWTQREGAVARLFERFKTLQSRAILGAGNVNWLIADTLANSAVAAFVGGVNPVTWGKAMAFYKRLPPDLRKAWADELDVGNSRFQTHVPHLGAAVNNRWLNLWRAWRATPGWRSARPLRATIDAFLRSENVAANQSQRIAVAYKLLRNDTFARMDRNVGMQHALVDRLAAVFKLGPEEQMRWMLRNQDTIEENARRVNEIMGDFVTLTNLERRTVGRLMFFYPFLRYSTRLAFYTLPNDHPIKLSILAQLGNLAEDEQRELVGVQPGEEAMARSLMFGRFFVPDGKGGFREFNIRTLNPVGNAATESEFGTDLLTVIPPWAQWALGQVTEMDVYRWRPWNLRGKATRPGGHPDLGDTLIERLVGPEALRARSGVLLRQLLDLAPITREIQRQALPGEQSDEANLLFGEIPMQFRSEERALQAAERRRLDTERGLDDRLLDSFFRAFRSRPSQIGPQLERRRAARGVDAPVSAPTGPRSPADRALDRLAERQAQTRSPGVERALDRLAERMASGG